MRHNDRVVLSVRTRLALGAQEKPRRRKSLRTKGPRRSSGAGFQRPDEAVASSLKAAVADRHAVLPAQTGSRNCRHLPVNETKRVQMNGVHVAAIVEGRKGKGPDAG